MAKIILAMGGNLDGPFGNAMLTLEEALKRLPDYGVRVIGVSSWYRTSPVPKTDQPDFVNLALKGETSLNPDQLLEQMHLLEAALGRVRGERWSARTLDIDLIFYGDQILPDKASWQQVTGHKDPAYMPPCPVVPHPRAHKRAFVLKPLMDIAADFRHPVLGKSVSESYQELLKAGNEENIARIRK